MCEEKRDCDVGRLKCMDIYFALMLRIAYKSSKINIHTLQADNGEAAQALYAAAAADQPE